MKALLILLLFPLLSSSQELYSARCQPMPLGVNNDDNHLVSHPLAVGTISWDSARLVVFSGKAIGDRKSFRITIKGFSKDYIIISQIGGFYLVTIHCPALKECYFKEINVGQSMADVAEEAKSYFITHIQQLHNNGK
jgi:hypothetical protein